MISQPVPSGANDVPVLPALPLDSWKDTLATLHMWAQIVGKVRLTLCPLVNHWWNVTFYVTSRGMTTLIMPYQDRGVDIQFDFIDHKLIIQTTDGDRRILDLKPQSVADFYQRIYGGTGGTRPEGKNLAHAGGDPRSHSFRAGPHARLL